LGTFISTRGRYAIRVLIDLAEHSGDGRIPLKDIAERQNISQKYLESIMAILVHGGIVSGSHGKGGGYSLDIPPSECKIGSIVRLTEGSIATVSCLDENGIKCDRAPYCKTLPMWKKLDDMINDYLDGVSLSDLMDKGQLIEIEDQN